MTTLPVSRFGPLGLAELVAEAELLTRVDRKYLLDRAAAAALLASLDPGTRVLAIDGHRSFGYESIYFDTPDLVSYRQAAQARRHRFKVRTRCYLDTDLAYLEVKVRGARDLTVKDRIACRPTARDRLDNDGREYAGETLDRQGLDGDVAGRLRPTLLTGYRRITLLPPEPGVRVTVDTGLTWSDGDRELTLPDLVIVETKAGPRPTGVDRLLWRAGHRPRSVSKYGTGLAALRGDLPANKWARVLRDHFHTTRETPCTA